MIDIRFHTDDFRRMLERAQTDTVAGARNALGQATDVALQAARATTSFKDRSGELRRGIVRFQASTWRMGIKAPAKYALFVENDTKPHRIEPRRASMLRFVVAGQVRFARAVNHPGTKGTHFMERASQSGQAALERGLEQTVHRAFR